MKCIIIDDEPLAIDVLESYIEKIGSLEIVSKCTNPIEAINIINKEEVDLVFLDIEMPNLTGIELVKSIDKLPQFIFTTAYPQYALQGFDLNATDYLVKPIPFHRFLKAISRANERHENKRTQPETEPGSVSNNHPPVYEEDFIFIKADYENVKVYLKDICYIEGLKDYIKIHLNTGSKPLLTLSNFKGILDKLPSGKFLRVHRSYVVNIEYITALQKSRLILNNTKIPIGNTYRKEVLKRLKL
ncbi:response regulator transcription factor [Salegentibacter sp. LM13S]|uniref:LytR/AlgR family response regulator transcription factor n=1 Tax=Salegentibacter lacus TaxID=2873599 RepID=UPI001CCBE225|nr:response regulator transcription factor [Salegentibacter lacus]MBZ9631587.1 response regulator transcription factor [Salegentibacter lacus]